MNRIDRQRSAQATTRAGRVATSLLMTMLFSAQSLAGGLSPEGDAGLIHIYYANLACAAVQKANPKYIESGYKHFLDDAIKIYPLFWGEKKNAGEPVSSSKSFLKHLSSEVVIKNRGLRSSAGARSYLYSYLKKTDAVSCDQLFLEANKLLEFYGTEIKSGGHSF